MTCVGGRTQWDVGGDVDPLAREVRAPAGVVDHEPAEMIVRVGAGTTWADLDRVLAGSGQMVPLDPPAATAASATVGGMLAVGASGHRRLRYGPIRDTLLEARIATADGKVVKAGAPVVKNVTGYDLCRLFVGSLGTLGFLVEAVLRCHPRPRRSQWFTSRTADPFEVRRALFRPSSILWDSAASATHVLLEGRAEDIAAERHRLGKGWEELAEAPIIPDGPRTGVRPSELRALSGSFVAEIGVGTVHGLEPAPAAGRDPVASALHRRMKAAFDPTGRLNPGRAPW